ncbi:hypothetical protein QEL93_001015 [Pseudomonas putida]|nr:hypothetical protein [Pseudomonas putida]
MRNRPEDPHGLPLRSHVGSVRLSTSGLGPSSDGLFYQKGYYTPSVVRALMRAARRAGYQAQAALLVDFASDASAVMSSGVAARAGCLAIPTENIHGVEIVLDEGIEACAATLVEYLLEPNG